MKSCIWLQRLSPTELLGSIYGCAFTLDDDQDWNNRHSIKNSLKYQQDWFWRCCTWFDGTAIQLARMGWFRSGRDSWCIWGWGFRLHLAWGRAFSLSIRILSRCCRWDRAWYIMDWWAWGWQRHRLLHEGGVLVLFVIFLQYRTEEYFRCLWFWHAIILSWLRS